VPQRLEEKITLQRDLHDTYLVVVPRKA
jgi:hypothetical protein